jgi:hypothetical protein
MTIFRTQSTSSNPPSKTLFPALPLELREIIYHHAILPNTSPIHPHRVIVSACDAVYNTDPRYPVYLPPLCRVSSATRMEVGLWYIRNTEFGTLWPQYLVYLSQFLSMFPDNAGFAAVRRLKFEAFGRHVPLGIRGVRMNEYLEFMKKCSGLVDVRIKFEIWHLLKRYPKVAAPMPADLRELYKLPGVQDIIAKYGLQELFELQSLRTLHVEVWPKVSPPSIRGFFEYVPDCWAVMESLVEWLKQGFEDMGMKVDVRLVECANQGMRWAFGRVEEVGEDTR